LRAFLALRDVVLNLLVLLEVSYPSPEIALKCTNTSALPSSGVMKPKPFSELNHCQAREEHCGFVFEGKVVFHTADGDEEFVAADAYFVGPGQTPSIFAGTSIVEFSPTDRLNQMMEVVTRNVESAR
jgi:hypothetical protein